MRAVKGRDTGAELRVRRAVYRLGFRYRIHQRQLPGCPDLAFHGRRKAIFVNGCFWHGHHCARGARVPKNNRAYWTSKIARNRERDTKHCARLSAMGWSVLTVWECEITAAELEERLHTFLHV